MTIEKFENELVKAIHYLGNVKRHANDDNQENNYLMAYDGDRTFSIDDDVEKLYEVISLFTKTASLREVSSTLIITDMCDDNIKSIIIPINIDDFDCAADNVKLGIEKASDSLLGMSLSIFQNVNMEKMVNGAEKMHKTFSNKRSIATIKMNDKTDFVKSFKIENKCTDSFSETSIACRFSKIRVNCEITQIINKFAKNRRATITMVLKDEDGQDTSISISFIYSSTNDVFKDIDDNKKHIIIIAPKHDVSKDTLNNVAGLEEMEWAKQIEEEQNTCAIKTSAQLCLIETFKKCENLSPLCIIMGKYFTDKYGAPSNFTEIKFDIDDFVKWVNINKMGKLTNLCLISQRFAKHDLPQVIGYSEYISKIINMIIDIYKKYDLNFDDKSIDNVINDDFDDPKMFHKAIQSAITGVSANDVEDIDNIFVNTINECFDNTPQPNVYTKEQIDEFKLLMLIATYTVLNIIGKYKDMINDGDFDFDELTYDNMFTAKLRHNMIRMYKQYLNGEEIDRPN